MRRICQVLKQRVHPVRKVAHVRQPRLGDGGAGLAVQTRNQRQRRAHRGLEGAGPGIGVEPQQALRLVRREGGCGGARVAHGSGARDTGVLRDAGAQPAAIEAPAVVRALQRAVLGHAALAERRQAVRALVTERAPDALGITPQSDALAHDRHGGRHIRLERIQRGDGIPAAAPVHALRLRLRLRRGALLDGGRCSRRRERRSCRERRERGGIAGLRAGADVGARGQRRGARAAAQGSAARARMSRRAAGHRRGSAQRHRSADADDQGCGLCREPERALQSSQLGSLDGNATARACTPRFEHPALMMPAYLRRRCWLPPPAQHQPPAQRKDRAW